MLNLYPPEEIVPALAHHNRQVNRYGAMMLGIGGDEQLAPFLANLLQSESALARRAAAEALGRPLRAILTPGQLTPSAPAAGRLAVESLRASLRDPDALVRANSARSLGNLCRFGGSVARRRDNAAPGLLRSEAVVLALIHALQDPVAMVRTQAAASLRALAAPAALPSLIPLLQDPDREVSAAAAFAAGSMGAAQSLPVLLELLGSGPRDARREAAVCLGLLGDSEAVPALMEALADPSRMMRQEAAVALGRLGDPRAVPALINALGDVQITFEECRILREYLVTALGRLGDSQAVPALAGALDDYDKNVRGAAVSALMQLDGDKAEDALIGLVEQGIFRNDNEARSERASVNWEGGASFAPCPS